MDFRTRFPICSITMAATIAVAATSPAVAAPWVRGYAVSNYEPAWFYGGRPGYNVAGQLQPGSDCPNGSTDPAPDLDFKALFKTSWRTDRDIDNVVHPRGYDTVKEYLNVLHQWQEHELTYRGFRKGINSYMNPFTAPDPGMPEVTGKIALGFDLDDNPNTGGFSSPTGQKGIDNAYYRAWGCIQAFRGPPYHAALSMRANDKMLAGLYTMVVRISGNRDPMNDDDATVEIGYSPDYVVLNAGDHVAKDYSYRIVKKSQYTKLKAKIKNGVVETEQVADLRTPVFAWNEGNRGEADFHKGRMRLTIDADGNVLGLIGGYRDWRDLYFENVEAQGGATSETVYHQNSLAMYYAIRRNADANPDPKTGRNRDVSIAYRFLAVPAYVIDPATPAEIVVGGSEPFDPVAFQKGRELFYRGVATRQIQGIPHGSPDTHNVDKLIAQLPDVAELKERMNQPTFAKDPASQ
jgi:hypothetical protein